MIESENVATENAADIFYATEAGAEWSDGPVSHVKRRVDDRVIAFFCRLLQKVIFDVSERLFWVFYLLANFLNFLFAG